MIIGTGRGTLILVVGPSGAGKDTLIAGARARLEPSGRFHFPRRTITRPAEAGGEDHDAVSAARFSEMMAAGAFALSWQAHGLSYGLPIAIEEKLARGRHVIVNVSRVIVMEAQGLFVPAGVVEISAPPEELRRRLSLRGRESDAEIEGRMTISRGRSGEDWLTVANTGTIESGTTLFIAAVAKLAGAMPANYG